MMRFAGHLFGVRGLESRQDYLYLDTDGTMKDARQQPEAYRAMEKMNAMAKEGLLSRSFMDMSAESSSTMLENDLGFIHYDRPDGTAHHKAGKRPHQHLYGTEQ